MGPAHANSICAFSGLEDGDGAGFPGPGGAPPQNWGHSKEFLGATSGRAQGVRLPARRLLQRQQRIPWSTRRPAGSSNNLAEEHEWLGCCAAGTLVLRFPHGWGQVHPSSQSSYGRTGMWPEQPPPCGPIRVRGGCPRKTSRSRPFSDRRSAEDRCIFHHLAADAMSTGQAAPGARRS